MALFVAMLKCRLSFEVLHVDHGWRPESGEEAAGLQKWVESQGIRFHLRTLNPSQSHNLEEWSREQRLALYRTFGMQVVVGHHADDQKETILKRFFEGSRLSALGGMAIRQEWEGLIMWRPLLKIRRTEIEEYVHGYPILRDPSNSDPRFLRTRIRNEVIPLLERHFGKNLALCQVGEEADELKEFLEVRLQAIPFEGNCIKVPLTAWEIRALMRKYGEGLPKASLDVLIEAYKSGGTKEIGSVKVDCRTIYFKRLPVRT